MSIESPRTGEISTDGQFRWDGEQWTPLARGHREATRWTLPMQRVTAAFLAASTLWTILTSLLFMTQAGLERTYRATNPAIPDEQARAAAQLGFVTGWLTVGIVSCLVIVLIVGTLKRWRWAFWVDLVFLALGSLGVVTNVVALTRPESQTQPPAAIVLGLLLAVASLALLVWFVVAAARYGPWAMRRPGAS
jgi:hypothetical protein